MSCMYMCMLFEGFSEMGALSELKKVPHGIIVDNAALRHDSGEVPGKSVAGDRSSNIVARAATARVARISGKILGCQNLVN